MNKIGVCGGLIGLFSAGCQASDKISCGEGTYLEGDECLVAIKDTGEEIMETDSPPEDSALDTDTSADTGADTAIIDTGEEIDTEEPIPYKSSKRGLAYNLVQDADFGAISGGVSWWYNWYFQSSAPAGFENAHDIEFVPMLWGYNSEADYVDLETWMLEHPNVDELLVLNEPNLQDQANMTPEAAVTHWLRYEQFQLEMLVAHGREIRLIGPAMTWGTMPGYEDPIAWLDAFYLAFQDAEGREPYIDALAFHWYDYGLEQQLTRLEGYGKPFWVTEMANWHTAWDWTIDTPEKQMDTMIDMVSICEARADVERYAWFIGRWDPDPHYTSIFGDAPGELTALGEGYLTQPW